MQHVHAEAEHVARLEVGGQPAVAEVALHHRRVGVEPGEPVAISVGGEVAGMESFGPMAVLEENQCSFVAIDATERDPTREDAARAAVHVRAVAMESATLARSHEAWPSHVEAAHLALEEGLVDAEDLRRVGHREVPRAGPDALGERSKVGRSNSCAVSGNRIVDRVTVVDLAEDRVLLQDLVTGGEHNVGLQESSEEQVPTLVHLFAECCGVGEEVIRRLELAEAGRCGVERVPVGSQHRWEWYVWPAGVRSPGFSYGGDLGYECQLVRTPRTLVDLVDRARLVSIGVPLDAPALTDGTTAWSWAEYADRVAHIAGALGVAGVRRGDTVGIHVTKSVHAFASVHAVLRAGAVVVPVDPLAPVDLAVSVLRDAGIEVLVSDARAAILEPLVERLEPRAVLLPRASSSPPSLSDVEVTVLVADAIETAPRADPADVDEDDPAYIIYTSGSTGRPKGIVHTHRSALAYAVAAAAEYDLVTDDRMVNIAPLHFDQSTFELYSAPLVGAAVLVVPDPVLRFPASVAAMVEAERATVWYSVPHLLIQMVGRGALAEKDLSSLRWILFGGEVFPPGQLAELMRVIPSARVSNVYGPAEVNQCTRYHLDDPPQDDAPVPIGRAWDAATLRVVVADEPIAVDRLVQPGDAGVLIVATGTMMAGYWRRDDLTAASIVVGNDGTRWYVTGDLVVENADGDLVFLGRVDNQVKVRGHRIELEAIDAVLADVEGVEAATVVVDRSTDDDRVVALLVTSAGHETAEVLDRALVALRRALPRYAVPAELVEVASLPRTSTGKIDRSASAGLLSS